MFLPMTKKLQIALGMVFLEDGVHGNLTNNGCGMLCQL